MRVQRAASLAVILCASLAASSALAGPAGSGLAHTEEVARKAAAAKRVETVRLTTPSRECVPAAVAALRGHGAVKDVSVESSDLIHVRTDANTAQGDQLQTLVAKACASAPAAAAVS